jgi:hypothetical protein
MPLRALRTTRAKRNPLGQWKDYRLLSSEATMPLALLVVGQHTPGKTIGEEQEKGYLVQHKFHSVCSRLPFPGGENKGQKMMPARICLDTHR